MAMHRGVFEDARFVSTEFSALVEAVFQAGELAKETDRSFGTVPGEGNRSIVTQGDSRSHARMVEHLTTAIPTIRILSEESGGHPSVLSKEDPRGILGKGIFAVIDPIDSTVRYAHDAAGWCVGGALIRDGLIEASAVYAPADNEGVFIFAAIGRGTWCAEWSMPPRRTERANFHRQLKDSYLLIGVDTTLFRPLMSVIPDIACNVQAINTTGSGILGMAKVALGKADAVMQTPQKAWDWVPAYRALLESGNECHFFRIGRGGTLQTVPQIDYKAFCSAPDGRLGYIAGVPSLVHKLWHVLPKTGWERIRPDTVQSTW